MSKQSVKSSPGRLRFQITLPAVTAKVWAAMARDDRRNKSNFLDVLIDQEQKRREAARLAAMAQALPHQ